MTNSLAHRGLRGILRLAGLAFLRLFYRIRPVHAERVPREGGLLLVANHVSYIDALVISAVCPREVRFVILDFYLSVGWLAPLLRLFGVIPISQSRPRDAVRQVRTALEAGDVVCIFPEGQLTRTGCLNEIRRGFELMTRSTSSPVLPVHLDSLWGSIFSFERGRFLFKIPRRLPYSIRVHFGRPIVTADGSRKESGAVVVSGALRELSAEALESRPEIGEPAAAALLRRLHHRAGHPCLIERAGRRRRVLRRCDVLSIATALADRWRAAISAERVGVLLPNSSAAVLVYLGLFAAGKVPLAVPFRLVGRAGLGGFLRDHGIRCVIGPGGLTDQWPETGRFEHFLEMGGELRAAAGSGLRGRSLAARIRPAGRFRRRGPMPEPDETTFEWLADDGESGTLEVRSLTGRQILANLAQLDATALSRARDVMLGGDDPATPAGFMLSLFLPLWQAVPTVHPPTLLARDSLSALLAEEGVTWLAGNQLVRSTIDALASEKEAPDSPQLRLRLATVFNEPAGSSWTIRATEILGCPICPCGVDDRTGIVYAVSMPDPVARSATARHQEGSRPGTLGRLLPGFAIATGGIFKSGDDASDPDGTTPGPRTVIHGPSTAGRHLLLPDAPDADGFILPPART